MLNQLLRQLPKMDALVERFSEEPIESALLKKIIQSALDAERLAIREGSRKSFDEARFINGVVQTIGRYKTPSFKRVVNGTGVVLHTNLGRAVLSEAMMDAIKPALCGYNTLEYDVTQGRRGSRYAHVEDKIKLITGAEAALVVNNNAAAVMLVLSTLAKGKEVVVSRGELVEIGGSFRVPDVMTSSGCKLKEIGTTNKTHLRDYESAIDEETAMLMKVHTSNYKIVGFTQSVEAEELMPLSKKYGLPVYEDLGSGLMVDLEGADEPVVAEKVQKGIDVLSFSGDKLFGGAQCGVIIGKAAYIEPMKKNPLLRAFRIDKMTLAVLEHSLIAYLNKAQAVASIPTLERICMTAEDVKASAQKFIDAYGERFTQWGLSLALVEMASEVGGGALPDVALPSYGVAVSGVVKTALVQERLRRCAVPVIAICSNEVLMLDFRTLFDGDGPLIVKAFEEIVKEGKHA